MTTRALQLTPNEKRMQGFHKMMLHLQSDKTLHRTTTKNPTSSPNTRSTVERHHHRPDDWASFSRQVQCGVYHGKLVFKRNCCISNY